MARKITGPTTKNVETYTFQALGNRTAPVEDQVSVVHRWPTQEDIRRATSRSIQKEDLERGAPSLGLSGIQLQEICRICVLAVENYEGQDGPISDGSDFGTYAETEFIQELGGRLFADTALTPDWCKVCGEDLATDAKSCGNEACATNTEAAKPEVVEGEEQPFDDSSDCNQSTSLSAGKSAPEGLKNAPENVEERTSATL